MGDFFPALLGKGEQQYRNPSSSAAAGTSDTVKAAHNLFAEIQEKSLASQAGFKHVEKNAHKKEGALPVSGEIPVKKTPPLSQ